jgi:DNA invertase Pin-like site-specific DNA recombinase
VQNAAPPVRRQAEWVAGSGADVVVLTEVAAGQGAGVLIRERTVAGLEAARTRGRRGGRPTALDARKAAIAQALYNDKTSPVADICRTLLISRATLYGSITAGPSAAEQEAPRLSRHPRSRCL